ncbi:MAG: hypothetical protein II039_00540, partial [Treponema sp.]|nr:hypothetical protein [Treponema sp.]
MEEEYSKIAKKMVEGGKCPFDKLRERFIYVLAKQYRATEGGLAARRFFWAGSGNEFFSYLQKSVPSTSSGNVFFMLALSLSEFFFLLAKRYKA